MNVFIDTNVLIYNQNKKSILYLEAHTVLQEIVREQHQGVITPYVINELHYYYLKHKNYSRAKSIVDKIFKYPQIKFLDMKLSQTDMSEIIQLSTKYRLRTFDAYHAYYCRKLKIRKIATFDTDFANLPWVKIYKPNL